MRSAYLFFACLAFGIAGCKSCDQGGCHDSIVVKAPQQTVTVDSAPPPAAPAAPPAAPVAPPAAPVAPPASPAAYPQMPMAYPQMPAAMPIGMPAGGTIRERTGLGLVFDSFEIHIPYPRLIAVPRPSEVTFHVPPQPVNYGYSAPMAMPMAMPMAPQYMPYVPQPMAPPAAPVAPPAAPTPPPAAPMPPAAPVAPPAGPVTEQQCDEIIEKCNVLKRLHQLRLKACDAASCPPK